MHKANEKLKLETHVDALGGDILWLGGAYRDAADVDTVSVAVAVYMRCILGFELALGILFLASGAVVVIVVIVVLGVGFVLVI